MSKSSQIPLPIRLEDYATWRNWISRPETKALEEWLASGESGPGSAYLWGSSGTGKSHLLQACCELVGQQARYVPLADLQRYPPDQVLAGAEGAKLIALDDIDSIEQDLAWQESLFGLYNQCQESDACLLVAATQPPQQLVNMLADLRSRLSSLPVFQLPRVTETHLAELLRLRATAAGMNLSEEVVTYCVMRLPREASAAVAFIEQLDQLSLAQSRAVTIPFIRDTGLLTREVGG